MMHDAAPVQRPLNTQHLILSLIGAALIVLLARLGTDALTHTPPPPAQPGNPIGITAPGTPASNEDQLAAQARAARQQREQELIERDKQRRERNKAEALRAREAAAVADQAAQDAKEAAWRRFYKPAPKCANPSDDATRVDCSNQYIRARERFEKQYVGG